MHDSPCESTRVTVAALAGSFLCIPLTSILSRTSILWSSGGKRVFMFG